MRENKLVSLHYASYLPSIWTDPKDTSFLWHRPQESTFLALSSFSYLWDTHWRCHFTLLPQEEWFTREKPRRNVYKFAATCDYEDSIRWDVACSVDLWVYPMQLGHRCESLVTSSITIFDPSIFRGVESFYYVSSSREAFRFRVVKGATRSTKEPCQKWLEEGLKPVTFKTVEGKGEFLWEKVSFKFSWWKKKLWSGTASWIFQWMIKRREFLWWKIWRISSLSFVLLFSRYDEISS